MTTQIKPTFPFSAVVGQEQLKTALLIATIDTKIGGVLVSGPRGSAKSTLARGIVDLLNSTSQFVTLPLGASEEQLTGSLDLNKIVGEQKIVFNPGLLAKAHLGVLYIDEVNLLADNLVDLLLDAAALGVNYVERDGISHSHPAEFILVGTMNPDEGELRPQLLDRFGLSVNLDNKLNAELRVSVVQRRLAFDNDPTQFCDAWQAEQQKLHQQILAAQQLLASVECPPEMQMYIAQRCIDANVDGLRADIVWLRAAKAYAALQQTSIVTQAHCDAVAEFVLSHRRHPSSPNDQQNNNHNNAPNDKQNNQPNKAPSTSSIARNQSSQQQQQREQQGHGGDWGAMPPQQATTGTKRVIALTNHEFSNRQSSAQPRTITPTQRHEQRFAQGTTNQNSAQSNYSKQLSSKKINWFKTLSARENVEHARLTKLVFHTKQRSHKILNFILLDTSASTLGKKALSQAKGLVLGLANQAYLAREYLAILGFGNQRVAWLLREQKAPKDCSQLLNNFAAGGGTPLRSALLHGQQFIRRQLKKAPHTRCRTILITDGRSTDTVNDIKWLSPMWIVDTEKSAVKLGKCRQLANVLSAQYLAIDHALVTG